MAGIVSDEKGDSDYSLTSDTGIPREKEVLVLLDVEDREKKCHVCGRPHSNAHKCLKCKKAVHAICGKVPIGQEEGYGSSVICNICDREDVAHELDVPVASSLKTTLGVKRKATRGEDSWWLKPKITKPQPAKVEKDDKKEWVICVTCFKEGKHSRMFKLCRQNQTTTNRHIQRHHANSKSSDVIIKPFYYMDESVKKARKCLEELQEQSSTKQNSTQSTVASAPQLQTRILPFNAPPIPDKCDNAGSTKPLTQATLTRHSRTIFNEDASQSNDASLHSKIDTLISEFKDFKVSFKSTLQAKESQCTPLSAVNSTSAEEITNILVHWHEVKNILDLVEVCKHMRFFSGDAEKGVLSVLRCETCFKFIQSKKGNTTSLDPAAVARKGLGGYSGSLPTGLVFSSEKSQLLLEGGNREFYKLKNTAKNHVTLAGGQLHFEALQYDHECKRRKKRGVAVMQNLVGIALTVVKTKSAAVHFETMVASHAFTGSDVGEFGHSRKQFQDILKAMEVWCDQETAMFLSQPLPSTRLPPHYYVTCDKATPNRMTNQAVMLCPMIGGQRQAVAVKAREVYHADDELEVGDVAGGNAQELAKSIYEDIRGRYPSVEESIVRAAWMGTACDGPYQARLFALTLQELLDQTQYDAVFFSVLWDAPHFVDLAFTDVFEGKIGSSKDLIQRLVKRSSIVHHIFQRGKILKRAMEMESSDDELVLRLTSRACSTRFTTSQYVEFKKLLASLPLFIKTFREFQSCEIKEYMIAGEDFVMDLCGVVDILHPLIEMFVELQSLSAPCWKVVTWWVKLKEHMEQMQVDFSLTAPTSMFPMLNANIDDIQSGEYKGSCLVPGWMIVSTEKVVDETGKTIITDNWNQRQAVDVEIDLKTFMKDILTSFETRMNNCTKEMQNILTCMDLDTLFSLFCGERLGNGKLKLEHSEGSLQSHGVEDFERFFRYICSLRHVRHLSSNDDEEVCLEPGLGAITFHKLKQALKNTLWSTSGQHLMSWFLLPKSYGCLKKLMLAETSIGSVFANTFELAMEHNQQPIKAKLNEEAVYKSIYTDETLYNAIGVEGCVAIDIALAKGGTEAVVESYYSVMTSQQKSGNQLNETLALRTKIDWCMPPILKANRAIKEVAEMYLNGNEKASLPKHSLPILGDRAKFAREGKVMKRHRTED